MSLSLQPKPTFEVSFLAELSTIEGILALVQEWAQQQGVHYDDRLSLRLVLEELLTNIALHNFSLSTTTVKQTKITLCLHSSFEGSTQHIHVHIKDTGRPFNPLEFVTPPLHNVQSAPMGQRGLSFVQLFTRNAQYIRREGNEFFFIFSLDDEKSRLAQASLPHARQLSPSSRKLSRRFWAKKLWPTRFYALWKEKLTFRQTIIITLYAIILMWGGMAIFYYSTQRTLQENNTQLAMQAMHTQDIISSNFLLRVQENMGRIAHDLRKMNLEELFAHNAEALTSYMQHAPISANIAAELPILGVVAGDKNTTWLYPISQGTFDHHIPIHDVSSFISNSYEDIVWKTLPLKLEGEAQQTTLIYAIPLAAESTKGHFIGVIVSTKWLAQGLYNLTNFSNALALYMDHEGQYIIFPPGRTWGKGPQGLKDEAELANAPAIADLEKKILAGRKGIVDFNSLFPAQKVPWDLPWQGPTTLTYHPTQLPGKFLVLLVDSYELGYAPAPVPMGFILVAIFGPLAVACITWTVISITLRPLHSLTLAIEKLSDGDTETAFPSAPFPDELQMMLSTFERVRVTLRTSFRNLIDNTTRQQRLTNELAMARNTQQSMLPRSLPQVHGTEISACLDMASEVCGDLYTSFVNPHNPAQIFFVMGDVCSKGIGAALIMSRAISQASSFLLQTSALNTTHSLHTGKNSSHKKNISIESYLCQSLEHLNESLLRHDTSGMFVSMLVASLDTQSGTFHWASAGHPPPLLSHPQNSHATHLPWSQELVLNVSPNQSYTTFTQQLSPGQSILLYTDGATEAMSPPNRIHGTLYGDERLEKIFHKACQEHKHTEEVLHSVREDIVQHMQNQSPNDDISLMVIRWEKAFAST